MKKMGNCVLAVALCLSLLPLDAMAADYLIPVGQVVGLELRNDTVSVAAFDELLGSVAKNAGLQIGDEIIDIDGKTIDDAEDVRLALERSDGQVRLRIKRDEKERELCLTPQITTDGPRLGVYLRQGITGIGTVTWYDPESGAFGTLGHGVNDAHGDLVEMTSGKAYPASVLSVKRGKCGEPGQLRGGVDGQEALGNLEKNTQRGVFGSADEGWSGQTMEVASCDEIRTGAATIRSTINGKEVREYSVEIVKIYPEKRQEGRNMLIRVTDPNLLETTGGIVQGMGVSYNRDNQVNP